MEERQHGIDIGRPAGRRIGGGRGSEVLFFDDAAQEDRRLQDGHLPLEHRDVERRLGDDGVAAGRLLPLAIQQHLACRGKERRLVQQEDRSHQNGDGGDAQHELPLAPDETERFNEVEALLAFSGGGSLRGHRSIGHVEPGSVCCASVSASVNTNGFTGQSLSDTRELSACATPVPSRAMKLKATACICRLKSTSACTPTRQATLAATCGTIESCRRCNAPLSQRMTRITTAPINIAPKTSPSPCSTSR